MFGVLCRVTCDTTVLLEARLDHTFSPPPLSHIVALENDMLLTTRFLLTWLCLRGYSMAYDVLCPSERPFSHVGLLCLSSVLFHTVNEQ